MSVELVMPKAGLTNTDGTIAKWIMEEGATVKKGDLILEIENEKTTMDFNSPGNGILHRAVEAGDVILVGGAMGYLAENSEEYERLLSSGSTSAEVGKESAVEGSVAIVEQVDVIEDRTSTAVKAGMRVKASPLAKAMARKVAVDIALIDGTGPGGRIVSRDVEKYVNEGGAKVFESTMASVVAPVNREPVRTPLTSTRRTIARRMHESLRSMAQTSQSTEVDVTELVKLRKKLAAREEELGTKITINDLLSLAAMKVLKKHPIANSEMTETEIITYPYVNLSFAVATDHGLYSPVIRNADQLSLIELSLSLREMVLKARDKKLAIEELTGGTVTITNIGILPVDTFNAIINPPQAIIIGFGRVVRKPVVEGDSDDIVVRDRMFVNLTYDHRVFDGVECATIMRDLKDYIENPELILL